MTQWNSAILSSSLREYIPQPTLDSGFLGKSGASEAQFAQLESRLETQLPPSYREFLQFTNGWGKLTHFIHKLWSAEEVDWFRIRNQDWIDALTSIPVYPKISDEEYLRYDDQRIPIIRLEYLPRTLEVSDTGEGSIYLLNPEIVTPDGEWEAWVLESWGEDTRYPSFWDLMRAEYQGFLFVEANVNK
jgi:hypothetical protein